MAQSYSVTAVLQAIDKNFSSTYAKAKEQAQALEKQVESVGGRSASASAKAKAAWANFGTSLTTIGANMTKFVTVPVVAGFAAATKVGMEFEQQMSRVQAILGASSSDMKKLNAQAEELGADTAFSAKEAAEGMEQLASAGFDTNEVMKAMPGLLDLAAVSGKDVDMASEYTASAIRQFGLEATEAGHVADVFARAAADTNAETKDMGYALKYAGTAANAAGWSLESTAAAIGIMSDAGVKGEQAGTTLRGALTRLMKPTEAMYDKMEQYGIAINNTDGSMKSLSELTEELQTKLGGLADDQRNNALATLFGTEALSGMLALMNAGPEKIDKVTDSLKNSDGSAKDMAKSMQNNLKGAVEEAGGSLETMAIKVYKDLEPALTRIVKAFTNVVNAFSGLSAPARTFIVIFAAIVATIGPSLWVLGKLTTFLVEIPKTFANLTKILKGVGGGFKALFGAIVAHPFIALIVAIVALFVYLVYLYKTNEKFRDKVNACWNAVKETVSKSVEKFKEDMAEIGKAIDNVIQWFVDLPKTVANAWDSLKETVANAFNNAKNAAIQKWEELKTGLANKIEEIKDSIAHKFEMMWLKVQTAFIEFQTWVYKKFINPFLAKFGELVVGISAAFGNVGDILSRTWEAIAKIAGEAWNIIKTVVMAPVLLLCDLITGSWEQLGKDAAMLWNEFTGSIKAIWDELLSWFNDTYASFQSLWFNLWYAISNTAKTLWNFLCKLLKDTWESFTTWLSDTWNKTCEWFKQAWKDLCNGVKNTWKSFTEWTKNTWKNFTKWLENTWNAFCEWLPRKAEEAGNWFSNTWKSICDTVKGWWNGLVTGAQETWEGICEWFNKLKSFDLSEAGRNIMDSFFNGLKSAWKKVQNFVGGIGDWIREHKGPASYDKRLLTPAGKMIMNGLLNGLESKFGAVQNFVKGVTACLSDQSVTSGIDRAMNDVNPTMTIDKNTKSRVRHEIDGTTTQPAYITLSMGGQTYKAFVSDIFNEHEQDADIRLEVF